MLEFAFAQSGAFPKPPRGIDFTGFWQDRKGSGRPGVSESHAGFLGQANDDAPALLPSILAPLEGLCAERTVERSLFRVDINSDCKYLEVPPGAVSH